MSLLASACLAANAVAATSKAKPKPNYCPIVAASGVLGASSSGGTANLGGVAGGLALGSKAVGGLSLDCGYVADTLIIQAPGHTFSPSAPVKCSGACGTVLGDHDNGHLQVECELPEARHLEGRPLGQRRQLHLRAQRFRRDQHEDRNVRDLAQGHPRPRRLDDVLEDRAQRLCIFHRRRHALARCAGGM